MKSLYLLALAFGVSGAAHAQQALSVESIMQGENWMGFSPENVQWDLNSGFVYFDWNPDGNAQRTSFQIAPNQERPAPIAKQAKPVDIGTAHYSADRTKVLFERDGDIVLTDMATGKEQYITQTSARESNPQFSHDGKTIVFRRDNNVFCTTMQGGIIQLTDFRTGKAPVTDTLNDQNHWLQQKQIRTFDAFNEDEVAKASSSYDRRTTPFYLDGRTVATLSVSPDLTYVAFTIAYQPPAKAIGVPNYVTASGYTESIPGRTKVGAPLPVYESYVYNLKTDHIVPILTTTIPGINDIPEYLKEYPEKYKEALEAKEPRPVQITDFSWNSSGKIPVANIVAQDNKDRWIMKLDPDNGSLELLDRQHDEAWVAGPGISRPMATGWINDNLFYFQSEATGYSHIYTVDVQSGEKTQVTSGNYEVSKLQVSNDRKFFYFTANMDNPGTYHFYRLPVDGGTTPEQLTTMDGDNQVVLSPDEKWLAIRHSFINQPWELYLQENKKQAQPKKITASTTPAFDAYPWRLPETTVFQNRYGKDVYAHILRPEVPDANRPAIVFVHSNGYLQNVHNGWSYHYREYMFNNLLVDLGYTVINIDYTGSSGYGRDFRTGIYRHMGGADLTDLVDGVELLVRKYDVNPDFVGLYGGSYGGFLTLMGLFTESETFKSGAALRSVTDWSNYNVRYTSNILNTPVNDPIAYERSSPLFFADGLKGHLLMTHGIVDVNVNFQDIILLTQRLLELQKDNWDLAVYPLEDHDFVEPIAWTDQYKRILKLFNSTLLAK